MSVIINIHERTNLIYAPKNFGQTISIVSYGENELFLFKSLSLWIKGIRAGIIPILLPLPYHNY